MAKPTAAIPRVVAREKKMETREAAPLPFGKLGALIGSLRPHQWVKNTLVFGGLIFSRSLSHSSALRLSIVAFVLFCIAASGVYLLNDLRDLREDRIHPIKSRRSLAAGLISPMTALLLGLALLVGSVTASVIISPAFAGVLGVYLVMNISYSLGLKRVVIVDVMIIAFGFVLRAVAGAAVIGVKASSWLILCTLMLALMVGFGKRRHELTFLRAEAQNHRASLESYSLPFLDLMMAICGGAAVVTYSLYTMAEDTVARVGSSGLVLTVPYVVYGIFRYLFLIHLRKDGGDPSRLFVADKPILLNVVLWVTTVCLILYGPTAWLPF